MAFNHNSEWAEQSVAPSNPAAGNWKIYPKSDGWYLLDENGTEYRLSSALQSGELFLPSNQGWPSTTSGCAALAKSETTTNKQNYQTFDFDPTASEYAEWAMLMPDNWDAGTITFKYIWTAAGGSGDVIFGLSGRAYADDDAIDQTWGTEIQVTDTLLATGDIHISAVSTAITLAGTPAAGQWVQLRLHGDGSDAGFDLGADAKILGIKIYYGIV